MRAESHDYSESLVPTGRVRGPYLFGGTMKAELNERNEVVVTMSRGEAQRLAGFVVDFDNEECIDISDEIQELGIELYLQK